MKTLDQAINYTLSLKGNTELIHKGTNYATFKNDVYGVFDIIKCYHNKNFSFQAYREHGTGTYPAIQHLFYIA